MPWNEGRVKGIIASYFELQYSNYLENARRSRSVVEVPCPLLVAVPPKGGAGKLTPPTVQSSYASD
jgi:hypothetical protein